MGAWRESWYEHWAAQLRAIDAVGGRRQLRVFGHVQEQGGMVQYSDQRILNFGSNDYLNLATHPEVVSAVQAAVAEFGWGSGASPLVTGRRPEHLLLEEEMASFEETEAALLFSSGYAANVAAVVSLVGRTDGIFSDRLNHASLIDGCRLSGADIHRYRHISIEDLEQQLKTHRAKYRQAIIVTDSLFSMDGDLAPLPEICELADRYSCLVVVDEAHATGIYGAQGAGWCHETKCSDRVLVRTGTMSKSIGGLGGFVVGPRDFIQVAIHRARSFVFSTAMPAAMAGAARSAIRIITGMSRERQELRQSAWKLRNDLLGIGCQIGGIDSPIIPIYIGDSDRCVEFSNRLMQMGCYVPAIRPPSVPKDSALLRISITSAHSRSDLEQLCSAIAALREMLPPAESVVIPAHGGDQ